MLRLTVRSQTPEEVVLQVDGRVSGRNVDILEKDHGFAEFDSTGGKDPVSLDCQQKPNLDTALHTAFVREIREGVPSPAATLQDGLNSLLLTLACLKSADEGRRVELSDLA